MASGTPTPHLGLNNWNGTDPFLRTEFNANFAAIDAAPGAFLCTSTTRPGSGNYDGRLILETDTNLLYIYDSGTSSWKSPLSTLRTLQYVDNTTRNIAANQTTYSALPDSPARGLTFVAPASGAVGIQVSGQFFYRNASTYISYSVRTGGTIGSGTVVGTTPNGPDNFWGIGANGDPSITGDVGVVASGPLNIHSGLTAGSTYNVSFTHYNSHAILATIKYRSLTVTPQP